MCLCMMYSSLAEPDYFIYCDSNHLDEINRYEKLEIKLKDEIKKKSIICLQEVSQMWSGRLHVYFCRHGYHFITGLYGKKFDGRMGVAIAVPSDIYHVSDVDITTLADSPVISTSFNTKIPYQRPKRDRGVKGGIDADALKDIMNGHTETVTNSPTSNSDCDRNVEAPGSSGTSRSKILQSFRNLIQLATKSNTSNANSTTVNTIDTSTKTDADANALSSSVPIAIDTPPGMGYVSPYDASNANSGVSDLPFDSQMIVWGEALKRHNQVITVRLKPKNVATGKENMDSNKITDPSFCVSTYHMPCNFRIPGVMLIHTVLLIKHIQKLQRKLITNSEKIITEPSILMGDFNFKPYSMMYNVITNDKYIHQADTNMEKLGESAIELIARMNTPSCVTVKDTEESSGVNHMQIELNQIRELFQIGVPASSNLINEMVPEILGESLVKPYPTIDNFPWTLSLINDKELYQSVYNEFYCNEPDFTNYACTRNDGSSFIDTLDYIFISNSNTNTGVDTELDKRIETKVAGQWSVEDVGKLPHRNETNSAIDNTTYSLPSENEPSDHLMMTASLKLYV